MISKVPYECDKINWGTNRSTIKQITAVKTLSISDLSNRSPVIHWYGDLGINDSLKLLLKFY